MKVKQLSELLAERQEEDASKGLATDEVTSVFGGGEEETFEAMVQRHRFSWSDINPADHTE